MFSLLLASTLAFRFDDSDIFLSNIRNAYHEVPSAIFFVRFTATDSKGVEGHGEVRYEYLAPNHLRAAFKGLAKGLAVLLCDGHRIATFASGGKTSFSAFSAKKLTSLLPTNVETLAFFDSNNVLSRERGCEMFGSELSIAADKEWKGKHWKVLRETNRQDSVQVDYYIDPATHFIWRTVGKDLKTHKGFIDAEVLEIDTKTKVDPSRFKIPKKTY